MKYIVIILGLIALTGCTTGETCRTNNIGDDRQSQKTYYLLGIPIAEEQRTTTINLPE